MTSTCITPAVQHRAPVGVNRTAMPARAGLWTLVKAVLATRPHGMPLQTLDDHMLRDLGIDTAPPATDPRDLILRL